MKLYNIQAEDPISSHVLKNDHFQYGELTERSSIANGYMYLNLLYLISTLAGFMRGSKALNLVEWAMHSAA